MIYSCTVTGRIIYKQEDRNASHKDTQHPNQLQSRTDTNNKTDRRAEMANHQNKSTHTYNKNTKQKITAENEVFEYKVNLNKSNKHTDNGS